MKYCSDCGKPIEIEMDFKKSPFGDNVTFIKRCKHCKNILDSVKVKL